MKKTLFLSAILASVVVAPAMAESTTVTIAGKNYTFNNATTLTTSIPSDNKDYASGDAIILAGAKRTEYNMKSNAGYRENDGLSEYTGTVVIANGAIGSTAIQGGQLALGQWTRNGTGALTTSANFLLGSSDYAEGSGWGYAALRFGDTSETGTNKIVLKGTVTLADTTKLVVADNGNYIEGALNGDSQTLNLEKNGKLHLSGGATLGTLNMGSAKISLDTTKSDGTTDAASTDYTIGKLIGNGMTVNNGTTLTITKGIDGKVTNYGTLNFTGTVDVTATGGSNESITEGANAYSTVLYSRDIATTDGTINATDVTWTINGKAATETALNGGTFSGRAESTKYYVNEGGTIAYTANSALADTAATTKITVGAATTFEIASDAVLQQSRLTANAATSLSGSGTYAIGVSGLGSNVSLADGWTGWVRVTGGNKTNLNITGYKGKVEMNGFNGWTSKWDGQNSDNIKLTNNGNSAAWTNGAYTTDARLDPVCTFSGAWSGDGNFYADVTAATGAHMTYKYTGDISGWTGVFKSNSKSDTAREYVNLVFADNAKNMNAAIQRDGGVLNVTADTDVNFSKTISATTLTVNSGKTVSLAGNAHTIGALTINGTVQTSKNGTASGFVSGDVTVNAGGTLSVVGGGQDALGWESSATSSLTLLGSEEAKATFGLNYDGTGSLTLKTALNLSGHSQVIGNRSFNTYGGVITATGTDNVISAGVALRTNASFVVNAGGELLISGNVCAGNDGGRAMTKTGDGLLTISGDISDVQLNGGKNAITINGDGANTIITSASINGTTAGGVTLNNVTLDNTAMTLSGNVNMNNVDIKSSFVNDSTLTLSGTVGYTGTLTEVRDALTTGNGFGEIVKKGTIIAGGSGSTTTTGVTSWNINGNDAEYNGGVVSYVSGHTDVYYVNDSTAPVNITGANQLKVQTSTTLVEGSYTLGDFVDLVGGAQMTLTGNTALNLTNENGAKGIWMKQGAAIKLQGSSSVTVTDISIAAMGEDSAITATGSNGQIGNNATQYHQAITITNSAVTETGELLREYNISGGKVTINSGKTTEVKAALSDTTAVVVADGSTAKFTVDSDILSLSGDAVEAAANLTVAGDVELNSLTIAGGNTVTLGTAESHDHTLVLKDLTVTGEGSVINANLAISGGTMTMGNSVELGCSITLSNEELVLANANITGEALDITTVFTSVESLTLGSKTYGYEEMGWYNAATALTSLTFGDTTITGEGLNNYVIGYWNGTVSIADKALPEPATATLSLLALAGLCARRRRK